MQTGNVAYKEDSCAPSIRPHNGKSYIGFNAPGEVFFLCIAERPEGPYEMISFHTILSVGLQIMYPPSEHHLPRPLIFAHCSERVNNTSPKRRRSAVEIQALLNRYHQRQVTQAEFVIGEGICLSTLVRYLRREAPLASTVGQRNFIEIEPSGSLLAGDRPEPFRVFLPNDVSMEIPAGFCAGEVARLLSVIAGMTAS